MDIPFPAGDHPPPAGPLARFLPPLEEGSTHRALSHLQLEAGLAFDPFGISPRLALEVAQAGWQVLLACSNPVTRFVVEHTLEPIPLVELQGALARLASSSKDQFRLEHFLLELYVTECSQCGGQVSADYFVWDRETEALIAKGLTCPHCQFAGEEPVSDLDRTRAQAHARRGLPQALALEQVAPAQDPDREHAEAALSVYPARALYALVTLVNKVNQLDWPAGQLPAAQALLLSAMDAGNALWGHPEGRARPRQLIADQRYREINLWRALERAVDEWDLPATGLRLAVHEAGFRPEPGAVAIHPGPARGILDDVRRLAPELILTVPPRPNQAYWTLSALWAAWVWGRREASSIRVGLRRRRYDFGWHLSALRGALSGLSLAIPEDTPMVALMPEHEPAFLTALLAAADSSGFELQGRATRVAEAQACLHWKARPSAIPSTPLDPLAERMRSSILNALERRGEPAPYAFVHAAALCDLARDRLLLSLPTSDEVPGTTLTAQSLERVLGDRRAFTHLGTGTEAESGTYWLATPPEPGIALNDRIEALVLGVLRRDRETSLPPVDIEVCAALPGLLTPDRRWVQRCLRSYAQYDEQADLWRLRPEDEPDTRAKDCETVRQILIEVAGRLGLEAEASSAEGIRWIDPETREVKRQFLVFETSAPSASLVVASRSARDMRGPRRACPPAGREGPPGSSSSLRGRRRFAPCQVPPYPAHG